METQSPAKAETRAGRAWLLALLWTAMVLTLGSNDGSLENTSRLLMPFLRWLFPDAPQATLDQLHLLIRKAAHVAEYGVLALLARRALVASRGEWRARSALWALLCVLAIAAVDEGRQSLVPARTGSLLDVVLDLAGGILALALAIAYTRVMSCRRRPRTGP